jgi:hypothetical protein
MASKKRSKKVSTAKVDRKEELIKKYAALCSSIKRYATMSEFKDATGLTKDMITHHYGSLGKLKQVARRRFPAKFKAILDHTIFNSSAIKQIETKVKGCNRFVITTAVTGCKVDKSFMDSISTYCDKNNAEMLVLLSTDPAAAVSEQKDQHGEPIPIRSQKMTGNWTVDPDIPRDSIVVSDTSLNSKIHIKAVKLSAKHIDPATGFTRIGRREGSFIYASPKQRLKYTRNPKGSTPHAVMTTGAITLPAYETNRYMSDRTATIATHDHRLGAIIVEIYNNKEYYFRQVQAANDGSFVDLGVRYYPNKTEEDLPEALVLGDWHCGETDPVAREVFFDVAKRMQVPRMVLHDAFNGTSVNHHEEKDAIIRGQRSEHGELSVKDEFRILASDMNDMLEISEEVIVVKSNHDDFLDRYLRRTAFKDDPVNYRVSLDLAAHLYDGKDTIRFGVEKFGLKEENKEKVRWLKIDESFVIGGVELGAHGHGYVSGIRNIENAYGDSVTGHTHAPQILRGAWVVGTCSLLQLSYNAGPSDWVHASCLVYSDGSRQLINAINGRWKLDK